MRSVIEIAKTVDKTMKTQMKLFYQKDDVINNTINLVMVIEKGKVNPKFVEYMTYYQYQFLSDEC